MTKNLAATLILSLGMPFHVSSALADPDPIDAAEPITRNVDCNANYGEFSPRRKTVGNGPVRISGKLEVSGIEKGPKWDPIGSVFIMDEPDRKFAAGFQVRIQWRDSGDSAYISFGGYRGKVTDTFKIKTWKNVVIPFSVSFHDKEIETNVGGTIRVLKINHVDRKSVILSCASGQFKFSDVEVVIGDDSGN